MSKRFPPLSNAGSDDEDVFLRPSRRGGFGRHGHLHVTVFLDPVGKVARHAHYGLSLEHASRRQVEKWKLGLGAADARHSRARLGRLAIPQDAVARTVGHWPAAA